MKASIDLGLSVLCSDEFRREHGPVYSYEAMAEACDTSSQAMQQFCERTLAKIRRELLLQGVSTSEGMMMIEMLAKQGCYRTPHEDCRPMVCPTC